MWQRRAEVSAAPVRLRPGAQVDAGNVFVLFAVIAIGFFVIAVPPGWGLDEQSHVARAYQISTGVPAPYVRADGVTLGARVPSALVDLEMLGHGVSNSVDRGGSWWTRHDYAGGSLLRERWAQPLDENAPGVDNDLSNAAASTFVPYVPAAVGIRIGAHLSLGSGWVLLLGEIAGAATYVLLAWAGIRTLRGFRARWLVFAVALLPQALFQASYVTADAYTNGICLLFVAAVIRLLVDREGPSTALLVGTALAGLGVVVAKPTYAVLLAMLLAVPGARLVPEGLAARAWPSRRRAGLLWCASYLVLAAGFALLCLRATSRASAAIAASYRSGADPDAQLAVLLSGPFELAKVIVRTGAVYGASWVQGSVGLFGYNTVALMQPFVLVCVLGVALSALGVERIGRLRGTVAVAVAIGGGVLAVVAIHLSFTAAGRPVADGVQGRYFVPLLVPLALGLATWVPGRFAITDRAARWFFPTMAGLPISASMALWRMFLY